MPLSEWHETLPGCSELRKQPGHHATKTRCLALFYRGGGLIGGSDLPGIGPGPGVGLGVGCGCGVGLVAITNLPVG